MSSLRSQSPTTPGGKPTTTVGRTCRMRTAKTFRPWSGGVWSGEAGTGRRGGMRPDRLSDPVEGGCANDYVYGYGDPVNTFDLSGTQVSPPSSHESRRCSWLKTKITNLRNKLSRQKQNFHENPNRWKLNHPDAIEHQRIFREKYQDPLRGRLQEWDDRDCDDKGVGGLPSDAWSFATMPVPAPNQNLPPLTYSAWSRFRDWAEGWISGSHGAPGYTR